MILVLAYVGIKKCIEKRRQKDISEDCDSAAPIGGKVDDE